jgi:hypothetical protein
LELDLDEPASALLILTEALSIVDQVDAVNDLAGLLEVLLPRCPLDMTRVRTVRLTPIPDRALTGAVTRGGRIMWRLKRHGRWLAAGVALLIAVPAVALAQGAGGDEDQLTPAEVQETYDPENMPELVVGETPTGEIEISHVSFNYDAIPDGFPTPEEANVQTPEDLAAYVDDLDEAATEDTAAAERESGR